MNNIRIEGTDGTRVAGRPEFEEETRGVVYPLRYNRPPPIEIPPSPSIIINVTPITPLLSTIPVQLENTQVNHDLPSPQEPRSLNGRNVQPVASVASDVKKEHGVIMRFILLVWIKLKSFFLCCCCGIRVNSEASGSRPLSTAAPESEAMEESESPESPVSPVRPVIRASDSTAPVARGKKAVHFAPKPDVQEITLYGSTQNWESIRKGKELNRQRKRQRDRLVSKFSNSQEAVEYAHRKHPLSVAQTRLAAEEAYTNQQIKDEKALSKKRRR